MNLHRFEATVRIAAPLDEVWDFFLDPRNLPVITPPWLGLELTGKLPPAMHPGLIITYRVRPFAAIALGWVTEITHVVDRRLFVDVQRSGPYHFWHHQHHFKPVEGGTEMRDIVHYALPLGPIGELIGGRAVRRRVCRIFEFRGTTLRERFATLDWSGAPANADAAG
jgi:ligand-binding SRPBCC domain-containing protein